MIVGTSPVKVGHRQTPYPSRRNTKPAGNTKPPPKKRGFFIDSRNIENKYSHKFI
jgi:hypothetical protein